MWTQLTRAAGLTALTLLVANGALSAEEQSTQRPAVLRFADLGGIRDWRALGHDGMLIQGSNGKWFRATFYGPCVGLQFRDTVGFVTEPGGHLDRFSSVLVDGQRCWFRTFEETSPPKPPEEE